LGLWGNQGETYLSEDSREETEVFFLKGNTFPQPYFQPAN
jgi:hypothetical protein